MDDSEYEELTSNIEEESNHNTLDLSFINESNHYTMHSEIHRLIMSHKLHKNNCSQLFSKLNEYQNNFYSSLEETTRNCKYFAFKLPSSKPNKFTDVKLQNYVTDNCDERMNKSIFRDKILSYLRNEVFNTYDHRYFNQHHSDIFIVKVTEYQDLVLDNTNIDELNRYCQLSKNDNNIIFANDLILYKDDNFVNQNTNIIRMDYVTISRNNTYQLRHIREDNIYCTFGKNVRKLFNLNHDTSVLKNLSNYIVYPESYRLLFRDIFEYMNYKPTDVNRASSVLDVFNNFEISKNDYCTNKNLKTYNLYLNCYFKSKRYNYGNSEVDILAVNSFGNKLNTTRIWFSKYRISDINYFDVLPFYLVIKNDIPFKNTIYDNYIECKLFGSKSTDYSQSYSKFAEHNYVIKNLLDNYRYLDNNIKLKLEAKILHYRGLESNVVIMINKNFIPEMIRNNIKINSRYSRILDLTQIITCNADVYINVINKPGDYLNRLEYDSDNPVPTVYFYNNSKCQITDEFVALLQQKISMFICLIIKNQIFVG